MLGIVPCTRPVIRTISPPPPTASHTSEYSDYHLHPLNTSDDTEETDDDEETATEPGNLSNGHETSNLCHSIEIVL